MISSGPSSLASLIVWLQAHAFDYKESLGQTKCSLLFGDTVATECEW